MKNELKRNELKSSELKKMLLVVNGEVQTNYKTFYSLIPVQQRIKMNWLHQDFLPTILLAPILAIKNPNNSVNNVKQTGVILAAIVELFYLAQEIHNRTPEMGKKQDYQMSILIGDYLSATAFGRLIENDQAKWMERLGTAICRMNEGKTAKSQWKDKNFVPMNKKIENLHKEYGELTALAGLMGADAAGLNGEDTQIYTAFAFYAGVIQGIILNAYHLDKPDCMDEYFNYCSQYTQVLSPNFAKDLLEPLLLKLDKCAGNLVTDKQKQNIIEVAAKSNLA